MQNRAADEERIKRLIAQLNDDDFRVREQATRRLIDLGPDAARLLAASPLLNSSAEVKQRAKSVFAALGSGNSAGLNRLLWVLDEIGTPAARAMAEEMRLPEKSENISD